MAVGSPSSCEVLGSDAFTADSGMGSMMQDLAFAIPGVDEALAFAELMKSVYRFLLCGTS